MPSNQACGMAPLRGESFCFSHSPEHATEAAEARRIGGQRRKREVTLAVVYGLGGLDELEQARRLLELVTYEALALDNGVARNRLLLGAVVTRLKLIEVLDQEARLAALEHATNPPALSPPVFDVETEA